MTLEGLARKIIEAEKDLATKSRIAYESREAAESAKHRLEFLFSALRGATNADEFVLVDGIGVFGRNLQTGRPADGSRTVCGCNID